MTEYVLTSEQIAELAKGHSVTIKNNGTKHRLVPERPTFLDALDRAAKIVNSWPTWKQSKLGALYLPIRKDD